MPENSSRVSLMCGIKRNAEGSGFSGFIVRSQKRRLNRIKVIVIKNRWLCLMPRYMLSKVVSKKGSDGAVV